jgi:hypothetical protein
MDTVTQMTKLERLIKILLEDIYIMPFVDNAKCKCIVYCFDFLKGF